MTKKTDENINFEESLTNLEKIVEQLEQGQLPLDQSLKQFEQGVKLIRHCQQALKTAEQKVKILTTGPEGDTLKDFDNSEF